MFARDRAIRTLRGVMTTLVLLLAVSCRAVAPESPATVTSIVDVRGSWQKMDDRLPPISLDITGGGAEMRAEGPAAEAPRPVEESPSAAAAGGATVVPLRTGEP